MKSKQIFTTDIDIFWPRLKIQYHTPTRTKFTLYMRPCLHHGCHFCRLVSLTLVFINIGINMFLLTVLKLKSRKLRTSNSVRCRFACSQTPKCCSYEYSPDRKMCNLNKECEPTEGKHVDFLFCKKLASAEQEQCALLRRHASWEHFQTKKFFCRKWSKKGKRERFFLVTFSTTSTSIFT